MARNYANMSTSRWRPESGYNNLSRDAQWAHYMLTTQPDISAAGVLPLSVKRWASRAANTTQADVIAAIKELEAAGLVIYDNHTEELLVRGFVRDDGGYNNRKRRHVIERAVRDVESPTLRQALLTELVELGLPAEWVGLPESKPSPATPPAVSPQHTPEETFPQVDSLSDALSHSPSDRASRSDGVVVTKAVVVEPQPTTHNPQPLPPPAAPAVPADANTTSDGLFDTPPAAVDPDTEAKHARDRAFGLARWWIKTRAAQNTPVIAGGKAGPLHPLRKLIEPFTSAYTDDEIKQALNRLDLGVPSRTLMDTTLARQRKGQQRQPTYQASYEPRGTIALADHRGAPRESAQVRKARAYAEMAAQLDAAFADNEAAR